MRHAICQHCGDEILEDRCYQVIDGDPYACYCQSCVDWILRKVRRHVAGPFDEALEDWLDDCRTQTPEEPTVLGGPDRWEDLDF